MKYNLTITGASAKDVKKILGLIHGEESHSFQKTKQSPVPANDDIDEYEDTVEDESGSVDGFDDDEVEDKLEVTRKDVMSGIREFVALMSKGKSGKAKEDSIKKAQTIIKSKLLPRYKSTTVTGIDKSNYPKVMKDLETLKNKIK